MNIGKILDIVIAGAGAVCGLLFGEFDGLLKALVIIVVLDYITGLCKAIYKGGVKALSSRKGFKGIFRKFGLFAIVALAHMIDEYVIGSGAGLRTAAIFLFIANEGVSLLENAGDMGVPVPEKLLKILQQIKLSSEENKEEKK
jgi:toxin secretion/phage lysis holin